MPHMTDVLDVLFGLFRTKITVVIVRQESKLYSLITGIYTYMKGWRREEMSVQ
jgi:hypothetical protein